MVLKNSKWDKKAKYKFLKKHGLNTKPNDQQTEVSPKWTTKKKVSSNDKVQLEDSDDEWDSDVDEALINHFYPQLGTDEGLTREHKIKIKQQILKDLENDDNSEVEEIEEPSQEKEELDGIYLGTNQEAPEEKPLKFNLEEFISSVKTKPKTKKVLKNKMSDNFLEEYGLESYEQLNRNTDDYNDIYNKKTKNKKNEELFSRLNEFQEVELGKEKQIDVKLRSMTEVEKEEELNRAKVIKENQFYQELKKKFEDKQPKANKILDVNNFKGDDSQLSYLREKLTREDETDTLEDDINELLGLSEEFEDKDVTVDDVSNLLKGSKIHNNEPNRTNLRPRSPQSMNHTNGKDIDFIDSIIG
ncbi:uncharacterized protein KGF55_001105 [Candida pseudojiufengensis]|uniref:uncharacterized protein n=1 Tax=Candida pseudojiufengensis TaxID=497109 RepID=UPI002225916F|nr:uncharacterized protein KGF55_001105 [Candida pseudojiufengensis]KAI5965742.1 hypothetical protein KGF55_001105 [Candida pseudojiufengensis]